MENLEVTEKDRSLIRAVSKMASIKKPKGASIINEKMIRDARAQQQRRLFFGIGLAASLSLVLLAFEWKSEYTVKQIDLGSLEVAFEGLPDISITSQSAPTPPRMSAREIIEMQEEEEIEEGLEVIVDVGITEEAEIEELVLEESPQAEVSDEIFQIVEQPAVPLGGMDDFYQYLAQNLEYPKAAKKAKVEGKVYIQFVVDQQGNISKVTTLKGLGFGLDAEAVRVMKESPKWVPAKQRGRPVKSMVTLPLVFKLG